MIYPEELFGWMLIAVPLLCVWVLLVALLWVWMIGKLLYEVVFGGLYYLSGGRLSKFWHEKKEKEKRELEERRRELESGFRINWRH